MSINVKTENAHDATVQVHIAFENANRYRRNQKRRRATRTYNTASLRDAEPFTLTTGLNKADHRSSAKAHKSNAEMLPYAPPSPARSRPAVQSPA